jgi:putative SOS response-associated peptidase YedK
MIPGIDVNSALSAQQLHRLAVAKIQARMPADKHGLDRKLSPEAAFSLLRPYPANLMDAYPVSTQVNSPKNNTPAVIKSLR